MSTIKPTHLLVGTLVVLIFVFWLIYQGQFRIFAPAGAAATVGGEIITKDTVSAIAASGGISYSEALTLAIETKKLEIFAKSEGLTLTAAELDEEATLRLGAEAASILAASTHAQQVVKRGALEKKLTRAEEGSAAGTYFEFPFGRYMTSIYVSPGPLTGNAAAIESDRQYARSRADTFRARVSAGESPATLVAELKADGRLVGTNSPNRSTAFTAEDYELRRGMAGVGPVREAIAKLASSGITPISEGTQHAAGDVGDTDESGNVLKDSGPAVVSYYFFVKIDSLVSPKGKGWLDSGLAKIKVVRYE